MKVFFTGPESLKRIPPEVSLRIVKVMALNAETLIGKLSNFDEIALRMLFVLEYPRVTIYQTRDKDSMGYPIVFCNPELGYYLAQDIAISRAADYMLAVYDGKSPRVAANLKRMPENRIRLITV